MISICMPSRNREEYLAETIESILSQTYKDWELIIVDDGSTDDSRFLYDHYTKDERIKVIYTDHKGIASARNTAVAHSKGEYIAVMDSDDICHPDRLKKQLKALKDDFVYSSYYLADEHAIIQATHYPPAKVTFEDVKANGAWPHVTLLAKRECFTDHPYREDFKVNDDSWLVWEWFKAGYKGKWVKEPLVIVRTHPGSTSNEKKAEIAKTQKIMDEAYGNYVL